MLLILFLVLAFIFCSLAGIAKAAADATHTFDRTRWKKDLNSYTNKWMRKSSEYYTHKPDRIAFEIHFWNNARANRHAKWIGKYPITGFHVANSAKLFFLCLSQIAYFMVGYTCNGNMYYIASPIIGQLLLMLSFNVSYNNYFIKVKVKRK